jgi:superoxide dismutase
MEAVHQKGALADAIDEAYGSFEAFKEEFAKAGANLCSARAGHGW